MSLQLVPQPLTKHAAEIALCRVELLSNNRLVKSDHPIHQVAKRTGLSSHVIRAWERRYGAVSPGRSGTNRRRYSDEEVERLRLLQILTSSGHRIGDVARLPVEVLRERVAETGAPLAPSPAKGAAHASDLDAALDATKRMDAATLRSVLERSALALGQRGFLVRFASPFAQRIGDLWASGEITAAHEHFASIELRSFLLRASHAFMENASAPVVVATTPAGQLHELGAAIVAAAARELGWRVVYLGPNLPAADIAHAAAANNARLVALSIVYPLDDSGLPEELRQLRRLLPSGIDIIAGGVAATMNETALSESGVTVIDDLDAFSDHLTELRSPAVR